MIVSSLLERMMSDRLFPHKNPESIKPGMMADTYKEMGRPEMNYNAQKYWILFLIILDEDSRTHADFNDIIDSMNIKNPSIIQRHTLAELLLRGYVWDDALQGGTTEDSERLMSKAKEFFELIGEGEQSVESTIFPDGLPRMRITKSGRDFLNNYVKNVS